MKKLLTLLLITGILSGCSKNKDGTPEQKTGFKVSIGKSYSLSTGETKTMPANILTVKVWRNDNNNIEIKSGSDALEGYAYNKTTGKSVTCDYSNTKGYFEQESEPGKYLIFVMTYDQGEAKNGRFSYSDTTFNVIKGELTPVKKDFAVYSRPALREDWNYKK